MTDVELLPLPEPRLLERMPWGTRVDGYTATDMTLYSKANVDRIALPLQAKLEATRDAMGWVQDEARGLRERNAVLETQADAFRTEVERLNAELTRLYAIAGHGGVSGDAPERLVLAPEVYDGVQACDKWCDVRRVVDDGQPLPESATVYVRADCAEKEAAALREEVERWRGECMKVLGLSMQAQAEAKDLRGACDVYQARAERLAEALREAADDLERGIVVAQLRARAALLRDQEDRNG